MHDDNEVVFVYHVPDGVTSVKVSTDGSEFDTVLYARASCDQPANPMQVMDLACNDNDFTNPPQSTIFLTDLMSGSDVFIVVDGNADAALAMQASSGNFTLSVTTVTPGTLGNPCRAMVDMNPMPLCDGALACSMGGAADGTSICVGTVAVGQMCDVRGFMNTCATGSTCAEDPSPPDGTMPTSVCATPGTHAGAACRTSDPRCDAPLVCGTGDAPMCVRVLNPGDNCDLMGAANACPTNLHCLMVGDAGVTMCR
jgi:hypothetical protein